MLRQPIVMNKRGLISILVSCFALIMGCTAAQKEIRASIEQDPEWRMIQNCGYEGCTPTVDFLIGKEMTIRIECDNDWQTKQFFTVGVSFDSFVPELDFYPSRVTIKMGDGEVLMPKGFSCSYTISNLEFLRSHPELQEPLNVKKRDCFLLFFDHPALSVDEEVVMYMDQAVTSKGTPIRLPPITFKKNPKLKDSRIIKGYFR